MTDDDIAIRRKRLALRSRYRGSLESDLIFGRFAEVHLDALTAAQLDRYEALLAENDQDLVAWASGRQPVPARHDNDVMMLVQAVLSRGLGVH